MSVLIKGMKMPENCFRCKMCFFYAENGEQIFYCNILCKKVQSEWTKENGCPLIEVPQHGRLIDADALTALWTKDIDTLDEYLSMPLLNDKDRRMWLDAKQKRQNLIIFLSNLPTVIEAEEGE